MRKHIFSSITLIFLAGITHMDAQEENMPKISRERIEWCNIWVVDGNKTNKPRVLMIGDSITQGYYPAANAVLEKTTSTARLTTSAFVGDPVYAKQLDLLLDTYTFDVIHFNNGLHGWGYSEEDYKTGMEKIVAHLRAKQPQATLVLALSTPLREREDLNKLRATTNDRVIARNRIVTELAAKEKLVVNDLYNLVIGEATLWSQDATHFGNEGREMQGKAVAEIVGKTLAKRNEK